LAQHKGSLVAHYAACSAAHPTCQLKLANSSRCLLFDINSSFLSAGLVLLIAAAAVLATAEADDALPGKHQLQQQQQQQPLHLAGDLVHLL
jgi:hypothetical protein